MRTDRRSREQPASQSGAGRPRRDRRGRGVRARLAPRTVPITRSPSEIFDDLVLDAVDELESHWSAELADVEFAVEEVPPTAELGRSDFDREVIVDRGIPLGRLIRSEVGADAKPVVLVYRRPIEARSVEREDRGDLVFMVVAQLVAELLGRDVDEIDPPRD